MKSGPTSHRFISQRLQLHYVDWGNADAPPLVLVHGGRDHCRSWDWVADNGFIYWLAVRKEEGEAAVAEIYWHDLESQSVPQSASVTLPEGVTGIYGFDVDDGYFVLEASLQDRNQSGLILFDLGTGVIEILDLAIEISAVQIIHVGE